jgi:lipopolysaccharide/colanic/teichoic acid biosynthesis glycosyltransferase
MHRFCDVLLAALALVALVPLLVPIMLVLRCTGEGEIFFRQRRVGKDGRPFELLKFATMLKDSPNLGAGTVTLKDDPRILPMGRWLRKTKINELPQLLNVLRGDMSLVGPRPQEQRCFDAFPPHLREAVVRARPGLSGIGSIVFRDEEEMLGGTDDPVAFYDRVIAPYKGEIERWYVDRPTLKNYCLVILATLWIILFPKSKIAWKWFKGLPSPPPELANYL